jgi:hypothetical protein
VTLRAKPRPGYQVKGWIVDGVEIPDSASDTLPWNITGAHEIDIEYEPYMRGPFEWVPWAVGGVSVGGVAQLIVSLFRVRRRRI